MQDQGVHELALIGRVGDDRVGVAVLVERQGVLTSRDVARIGAAQPVDSRWRTNAPSPQHGSANVRTPRKCEINGGTAAYGVG